MKKFLAISTATILFASLLFGAQSITENAKKAKDMVKKAISYYKKNGKVKAMQEFSNPKGQFRDGEYYIFVFDFEGLCLARSDGNTNLIGKNMIDMQDPDGTYYISNMVVAAKQGTGWVDYKRSNPVTKKIEPKSSYIEKVDTFWLGCGFYK